MSIGIIAKSLVSVQKHNHLPFEKNICLSCSATRIAGTIFINSKKKLKLKQPLLLIV